MSTDLEQRLHDELHTRAHDAGTWATGGATLRRAAADRRTRRLRTGAAAAAVIVVAGAIAASLAGGGPDRAPVVQPTPTPVSTTQPDPAWLQVPLTDEMSSTALAAAGASGSARPVVSVQLAGTGRVVVLLADAELADLAAGNGLAVTTVTLDSSRAGAAAVSGTSGRYPSWSSLVAQPFRDGDRTGLLVLLPPKTGDTVIATSSQPGGQPRTDSQFVHDRLAVLTATAPDAVTRVRVLREGRTVVDTIPAASYLGPNVPRTLERVVASSAGPPSQPVQVRTDGSTACRLTVGSWWEGPPYVPWNPFDDACAPVDGELHLLLADDRQNSSVAGLAPSGTTSVRLYWRSGSDDAVSEVGVTADTDVTAFVDSSGHRPDTLLRAEAIRAGDVIATATP